MFRSHKTGLEHLHKDSYTKWGNRHYNVSFVRNEKGSDIRSYLQANKLAYCSFTDVARRHRLPRSEAKDFITHDTTWSMSFMFMSVSLVPVVSWRDTERPRCVSPLKTRHLFWFAHNGCLIKLCLSPLIYTFSHTGSLLVVFSLPW